MAGFQGIHAGWIEGSVGLLLREQPGLTAGFPFALITSLDSSIDLRSMPAVLRICRERPELCNLFNKGLLIAQTESFQVAAFPDLFFGFDEVWFFKDWPTRFKPEDTWITGPTRLDEDEGVAPRLVHWIKDTECMLGMGDGIGMNYVTVQQRIAEQLHAAGPGS